LSKIVPANNRISQDVQQAIPDRRTSQTKIQSAIRADPLAWYDQELSSGDVSIQDIAL